MKYIKERLFFMLYQRPFVFYVNFTGKLHEKSNRISIFLYKSSMRAQIRSVCLIVFVFLLSPSLVQAGIKPDYFSLPKVVAIEERKYDRRFELGVGLGYFPSNAYNRYFSGSLSGFYKFSPSWGWEVFRFDAMREEETSLKRELLEEFNIEVQNKHFQGRFLPMKSIIRTSLVWEPFYNKGLFMNSMLVYSNFSVLLNVGSVFYKGRSNQAMTGIGGLYKIFFGRSYALKIDMRQSFVFDADQQEITDFTELSVGLGYYFGGGVN